MIKWPSSITHITSLHEETNNLITLLQHENFIASTKESNKFIEKSKNPEIQHFNKITFWTTQTEQKETKNLVI